MNEDNHPGAGASKPGAFDNASEKVARETSSLRSQARAQFDELAEPLRENARNIAEQQKAAGADRLAQLGTAVHGAASGLEKELPQAAQLIHTAAENIEHASSRLRDRSVDDLVGMFTTFAKQQPAAAFAGSLLAGFAFSRFLKSSSAQRREHA